MTNWWFGTVMTSSNSSTWRCRPGEWRRERANGKREKKRKGWEMKGIERTNKGRENQRLSLHTSQDTKEDKSHPSSVPIPDFPLKLGVGNLTVFSLFSSLTFPKSPSFWHSLFGLSVCHWLLHLPFTSLGCHPSVLPPPSSSANFPWAPSKRPPPPPPTSLAGSTHLSFSSLPNPLASHKLPFQMRVFMTCWWQTGCGCSDCCTPQRYM